MIFVVVKGLCQGLVLSDYVSLVVDGVYLKRFSSTSGAPVGSFVVQWQLVPSHGGDLSTG